MAMLLDEESDIIQCQLDSLGNPDYCDVKIVATDGELPVSKFVLSLRSEYFRLMFSANNNFVESQIGVVKMPYSKTALEKLVIYLYSGKMDCEGLTLGSLLELLDLLNLTNLPKVFEAVENFTKSKIKKGTFSLRDCLRYVEELASDGKKSGLYDKDRIIEMMEQSYCETRTETEAYRKDIETILKGIEMYGYVPGSIQNKYKNIYTD